jgi:hypothetical protein
MRQNMENLLRIMAKLQPRAAWRGFDPSADHPSPEEFPCSAMHSSADALHFCRQHRNEAAF